MITPLSWLKIGIAVLVTTIISFLSWNLHNTKAELKKTTAELVDASTKVKFQNNLITDLKTAGDKKVQEAMADLEKAKLAAATHTGKAQIIYKTLPADPANDCKSALDLGNQQ